MALSPRIDFKTDTKYTSHTAPSGAGISQDFGLNAEAEGDTIRVAGGVSVSAAAVVDMAEGSAVGGIRRTLPPVAR